MTDHLTVPVARVADYEVRQIPHADGVAFIVEHHYSRSAANTSTYAHGLFRDGELVGAVLWIPPTKTCACSVVRGTGIDWRGVLACSRLAVHPDEPLNAASLLLGRSMRAIDRDKWAALVTYADTRLGHTGSIYRATNWICFGETKAGDVWLGPDGEQRGRKRGPRTLLASEMIEMGFVKAPPMPKIKFVHFIDKRARRFAQAKARGLEIRRMRKAAA